MSAIIVCGMPDEKQVLAGALRPGTLILSGADKLNLLALVPPSCTRIISMGLCGGLAPPRVVGDVVAATTVVDRAGTTSTADAAWNFRAVSAAAARGHAIYPVPYYSSGLLDEANAVGQRMALYKKYGTDAIDDETRYVAAEAARRGVPFNVIRPLSDDYRETLPLAATGPIMNADGGADIDYLLRSIAIDPGQVIARSGVTVSLLQVARDYGTSLDALGIVAAALSELIAEDT